MTYLRCVKRTFIFLQEVITNEHVVAMMKAAISETEDMPMFVSSRLCLCRGRATCELAVWRGPLGSL